MAAIIFSPSVHIFKTFCKLNQNKINMQSSRFRLTNFVFYTEKKLFLCIKIINIIKRERFLFQKKQFYKDDKIF